MNRSRWFIVGALVVAVQAFAQQPQTDADKPVEETKKNIKVLKGLPTSQLIPVMAFMANSLGVTCSYCHGKEYESDEKEEKDTARGMINMVKDINSRHFADDELAVTCNSCHQGHVRPQSIPLIADAGWNKKPSPAPSAPALPTVDDVLARYVTAVGGAKAIAGVKSVVETGTVTRENGRVDPVSKPVTITLEPAKGSIETELSYPPEANQEIRSWLARLLRLDEAKPLLRVSGIVPVRGRDAYAVEVKAAPGTRPDWLYFDVKDGLLVRRRHDLRTILGVLPAEYDFDDYRQVDSLKVPFKMTWSRGDYKVTHQLNEVKVQ